MNSIATHSILKTLVLTTLALIAFAANSVLCRMALGEQHIDAASFSVIRLLSGAVILMLILSLKNGARPAARGNWLSASMLFLYAIAFSYAYLSLHTGTGALILFASVQITMILLSLFSGNRLHASEWLGVAIAFAGFVYLVLPGVSAPSLQGFVLMTVAGIAWGVYSLRGRGSQSPLADTAFNFLRTLPFAALVLVFTVSNAHMDRHGVVLAMLSGAVASGIGYSIWYAALGGLSTTQAAVVQLSVPVIAALGGVVLVSEPITLRLVISSVLILGGILLVVMGRRYLARA